MCPSPPPCAPPLQFAFNTLQRVSPVSHGVCNVVKRIAIIFSSVFFFNQVGLCHNPRSYVLMDVSLTCIPCHNDKTLLHAWGTQWGCLLHGVICMGSRGRWAPLQFQHAQFCSAHMLTHLLCLLRPGPALPLQVMTQQALIGTCIAIAGTWLYTEATSKHKHAKPKAA